MSNLPLLLVDEFVVERLLADSQPFHLGVDALCADAGIGCEAPSRDSMTMAASTCIPKTAMREYLNGFSQSENGEVVVFSDTDTMICGDSIVGFPIGPLAPCVGRFTTRTCRVCINCRISRIDGT
jgi:hypothetical protein